MAVPPEQVSRFRVDLEHVLGGAPDGPIALAVSGGPDSMAMLALGADAFAGQVIAATVDHGLRPASAGEAGMVARACAALGVPHSILRVASPPVGNLQAWARRERYALLGRWSTEAKASALCTAHHADDQAETFLMRAARAAGLAGLAGVRARNAAEIPVVRPFLAWRRADLRAVVESAGLPFVDDPSNTDPRFDRARFRHWLGQAPWIDARQIARSAEHLAQAEADLRAVSDWLWSARAVPAADGEAALDVSDLPRAVRRSLARTAIETLSGAPVTDSIEPLLDALEAGKGATRAGVQGSARGAAWRFRKAPPRRTRG